MAKQKASAKVESTTTKPSKASPSIEVLTRKVEAIEVEIIKLRSVERLAVIGRDGARLGFSLPAQLDPAAAYQWLVECQRQRGPSWTTTPQQNAAALQIEEELITPVQLEIEELKAELKALKLELQTARDQLENESTPELLEQHRAQVKLVEASAKHHRQNVERLQKNLAGIQLEIADLTLAQQAHDDEMAVLVEAGKPVDDDQLVQMLVKRQAIEKRKDITSKAVLKAQDALKLDRQSIDQHQAEINRLMGAAERRSIRSQIDQLIQSMIKSGLNKSAIVDQLKAAAAI